MRTPEEKTDEKKDRRNYVKTRAAYPTTVIRLIKAWRDMILALMMSILMANMMRNVIGGIRIMLMVWMMPWVNWMSGGRPKY